MGCATSQPAVEQSPKDPSTRAAQLQSSVQSSGSVHAGGKSPQTSPLYASPGAKDPQNGRSVLIPPADAIGSPHSNGSTHSPEPFQKRRSQLFAEEGQSPRARPRRESTRRLSDEESNWDQCSTGHFEDMGNPDAPEVALPSACPAGPGSPISSPNNHSAPPPAEPAPDYVEYKETTRMRVEKFKGCMFVNQYLVVKFLGRGACGKVFLCLNTNDLRLYAMKAVRKVDVEASQGPPPPGAKPSRNPMEDLKREILIMRHMKHNNIVMLSEVIDDPAGSKLLLVMEFLEGGPVLTREALEKREKLPEMLALQYFRDMVKSLDYLHCNKVVHGDLKPENVLMAATGEVKLSDFGCSKIFATGNEYLERCNGTPAFLAPEMMKPNSRFRGRPTDVYALGACLYTLVYGRIPFSAPNLYKLFQVVQHEPVRYPEDVPVTDSLKHLLNAMLSKNPRDRITLSEVMRHPWVTMSGNFPLKSTKDLKGDESQERHAQLVGGLTFAEAHPCPDYLSGLAMLSHHERTFRKGDIIMRQSDPGTFLLYIVSGTVDVLVQWMKPGRGATTPAAANGGGDEFAGEEGGASPLSTDPDSITHRLNLARAAAKAHDFVESLEQAAGTSNELLVAQRGPGDLVGEMSLFSKSQARCASVRCNSQVTARVITYEQLNEYIAEQPMARHQIRGNIWKKESEITIVDALVKLANAHDIIMQSLGSSGQRGLASGSM